MNKSLIDFRGDAGTPIKYEDIALYRDMVFLVHNYRYDEETQLTGAPAVGTFNYTGFLQKREGISFGMTYFSLIVADGHLPIYNSTGILADGGASYHGMRYDEKNMRFWRTGELVVRSTGIEQERKHIEDETWEEGLTVKLDNLIKVKMAHGVLDARQSDHALALYLESKKSSICFDTPAWHRRERVLRAFENAFLKYPSK